jgi:hypothetical protein
LVLFFSLYFLMVGVVESTMVKLEIELNILLKT